MSALLLGGVAAVSAADPGAMGADKAQDDNADDEMVENATEESDSAMPAQAGGPNEAAEDRRRFRALRSDSLRLPRALLPDF